MNWLVALSALGVSLIASWLLIRPAILLAEKYHLLDLPGRHKRHRRPIPNVGGVVLFLSLWLSVTGCSLFATEFLAELRPSLAYVFAGALIITLVGTADDIKPLSAWTKLLAQVAAGLVLYLGDLAIDPITVPFMGSYEIGSWSVIITVAWVVILTNAINLIDGLDGLATGVSLIAALTLAVVGSLYAAGSAVLFSYGLIGFLGVFLFFNRYPARVFLGDSGSLQIGYYFAVISLLVPIRSYTAAALYLPLLALGVPLLETVISITRRLATGRNVMQADRRHLFHYLALAGLSPKAIVGVFYGLSSVLGLFTVAMYYLDRLIVFGLLVLFMVVIFVLFYIFMARLSQLPRGRRNTDRR